VYATILRDRTLENFVQIIDMTDTVCGKILIHLHVPRFVADSTGDAR
jgi:hypothetical protein